MTSLAAFFRAGPMLVAVLHTTTRSVSTSCPSHHADPTRARHVVDKVHIDICAPAPLPADPTGPA
jgi:hypothetical protein